MLVHCSQGVSRSAALLIGYLMWRLDKPYDEVYTQVKAIRGVANPNIGFTCQVISAHARSHLMSVCRYGPPASMGASQRSPGVPLQPLQQA